MRVQDGQGIYRGQISNKADFYSLGMMMLELWIGKEKYGNMNENPLARLKKNDELAYPEDMPQRLLELLRALTDPNETKRAGFAEIEKWIKGETIFNLHSKTDDNVGEVKIIYNAEKKQIAHSK
jgi:serine/threonine protein kinase